MIELRKISKQYTQGKGTFSALTSIDLKVNPGEIIGVIGKSGAGKSTLLRCVNLLERPDSGDVIINNQSLLKLTPCQLRQARKKIGMIFQHFNLLHSRTAAGNIALPLELHQQTNNAQCQVEKLLELVGMSDRAHHFPSQLSGGQKQRVAIARALVTQPAILLCDEITSALDPETTRSILNLLRQITAKLNLSVLFITHDMDIIKTVADRVVVMEQGHIIEEASLTQLFKNPRTEVTKSLTQASLNCELPKELKNQLQEKQTEQSSAMIRVKFLGHPAIEPLIGHLIRHQALSINIFQANLEYIQRETIGMMILSATGNKKAIQNGLDYLNQKNCETEILGYLNEPH